MPITAPLHVPQYQRRSAARPENISDSRLRLAFPLFSPLHISPVKLVSPRNASPSVYLQRYLGHEATLTNLLPHCTRVQLPSFSIERCCPHSPAYVRPSSTDSPVKTSIHQPINMSATNVEKAPEAAVNDVANTLSNISISQPADDKAAANEAASASAAEGRRLYIGNLAYATTEGELKDFFKSYLVYAPHPPAQLLPLLHPATSHLAHCRSQCCALPCHPPPHYLTASSRTACKLPFATGEAGPYSFITSCVLSSQRPAGFISVVWLVHVSHSAATQRTSHRL